MSAKESSSRAAKLERKKKVLDEETAKKLRFRRATIIVVVVLVIAIAAALIITSDLFYTSTTALTVGETRYSPAEFNVFYRNVYNQVYNTLYSSFGDSMSYVLDTSKGLDEQQCIYNSDLTWAEYLKGETVDYMTQVTALNDDARKNGYTLPEETAAEIESSISNLSATATLYGYNNLNSFLALNYGKGVNQDIYRKAVTLMETATAYNQHVQDSRSYSKELLSEYYTAHADDMDVFSYYAFPVDYAFEDFVDEADQAAQVAAAQAAAKEVAESAKDLDTYLAAGLRYDSETPTLRHSSGDGISDYYAEWMRSADRKNGDCAAIDTDNGAYVVWFVDRDNNDYHTRSMRHILIMAEAGEDGSYSDEAIFAAQARVREIEQEWKENPTEEHFAELANQYSEDQGSNTNGGLYENIAKYSMVENIDQFLFDPETKPGDTTVVEGSNGSYEGYHLVYYVGESDTSYADTLVENELRQEDQTAWLTSLTESCTPVEGSGMRYVKLS